MTLDDRTRRLDGQLAVAASLDDFRKNFNVFTENMFQNFDWSNIVVAGSAVATCLMPVPEQYAGSIKGKREYYHEIIAPASDIDIFIHGIHDEKAAIERMVAIEKGLVDNLLGETIAVRTKNCITIASKYPNRHVQIVLRLYNSISQILTGFDVNCSCVAYDGSRVWASPRALAAFMTQCNDIDLSRRSPSYESRLSKYSHRGFEVYCDFLDRSKIDPTIFERSFAKTNGLARLLVLERLPRPSDRDAYVELRKRERGRTAKPSGNVRNYKDLKANQTDEIPEWQTEEGVSGYDTFIVPYGKAYYAKKIEKLFYTKDMLLNAEWNEMNRPPYREPLWGPLQKLLKIVVDIAQSLKLMERRLFFEEESKRFVSGRVTFIKDDPGRQEIGSFNPLDANDYTDMAYITDSEVLFRAIVENDVTKVKECLARENIDINRRDHCGRTALHVATMSSDSVEIVQALLDKGARLIARLQDGRTALHIAAGQGKHDFVNALLKKSEANEEEQLEKEDQKRQSSSMSTNHRASSVHENENEDFGGYSDSEDYQASEDYDKTSTAHSFVKVKLKGSNTEDLQSVIEESFDEPDILDVNAVDWDFCMSPLHHAIIGGSSNHELVIETLVSSFGADILLPLKKKMQYGEEHLMLNLTLPLFLSDNERIISVLKTLLRLGASSAQANSINKASALHYGLAFNRHKAKQESPISPLEVLNLMLEFDGPATRSVVNYIAGLRDSYSYHGYELETPLQTVIQLQDKPLALRLLDIGARATVSFQDFIAFYGKDVTGSNRKTTEDYATALVQPLERAIRNELDIVEELLEAGADPSLLLRDTVQDRRFRNGSGGKTVLDHVEHKIMLLEEKLAQLSIHRPREPGPEIDKAILEQFPVKSYKRYSAELQLKAQNASIKLAHKDFLKELETYEKNLAQAKDQREKVLAAIATLTRMKEALLKRDAKQYRELFPDEPAVPNPSLHAPLVTQIVKKEDLADKPWEPDFTFNVPYIFDDIQEVYLKLFESARSGDIATIRQLTSGINAGSEARMVFVAVTDSHGMSPFYLAVTQGHIEAAKVIFSISQDQYSPKNSTELSRYTVNAKRLGAAYDHRPLRAIARETVQQVYAYDNMAIASAESKCDVSPLAMLQSPVKENLEPAIDIYQEKYCRTQWTPLSWAVFHDRLDVVEALIGLANEADEDGAWKLINPQLNSPSKSSFDSFAMALRLGKTRIVETFMKETGCGPNFEDFEQPTGVVKPQYYLGLSINGKKRKDWAKAANPNNNSGWTTSTEKLLHFAAFYGNLDSVHWLLSERPYHCIQEFLTLHPKNRRAKLLAAQSNLKQIVEDAIGIGSEILPHLTIKGWNGKNSAALLQFWFSKFPHLLESRNCRGLTPFLFAAAFDNVEAMKETISAGADVLAKDADQRNIVHIAAQSSNLESILSCLPKEMNIKDLVKHRAICKGISATVWYHIIEANCHLPSLKYLISISNGHGLEIINGDGNLPLHQAVSKGRVEVTELLLDARPDLINKENANGRTALDIVNDTFLLDLVGKPVKILPDRWETPHVGGVDGVLCKLGQLNNHTLRVNEDFDSQSNMHETRRLVLTAVQKHPVARIRATLFEANELAKRLANRKVYQSQHNETPAAENWHPLQRVLYQAYLEEHYMECSSCASDDEDDASSCDSAC
ncbi:hypothetical protein BDZ91DRAFT_339191 [Kalaharituber pfeilii]|nr:hypothetical protein BDZ91DRAFT_339191 [Kalaharituber pfeilii]